MTGGDPGLVRRALGGHAAIGLLAGALIYIVSLTGSLIVLNDHLRRWEQPNVVEMRALSPDAAQAAMAAAMAEEAGRPRTTHLYLRLPSADLPRAVVSTDSGGRYVDASGRIVAREEAAWTEFLIGLHEYLHLPSTWGLILVGALGVAIATLAVTGVLAHPRILRDAFRLRLRQDPQIARADWHNRLGAWTLPFVLAVSLTGAFIGLGSVGASVLARAYTGGDVVKAYAPLFGAEARPDAAAAPLPDVAAALRTLAARAPRTSPTYVIVHDPGTRGEHVQILAEHPRRLIYGESYLFDGRGRWLGATGLSDGAIGQQAAASAYNLHFGNYGGPAVEIAYLLMGFGLCAITATGATLWLGKRRRRGLGGERLAAAWAGIVWGTPLAIVLTLWLRAAAGGAAPLAAAFWALMALALVVATARPALAARLRFAAMLAVAATALVHLVALRPTDAGSIVIDVAALLLGAADAHIGRPRRRPRPRVA